jgi:predicted flap endonuclease-1-like 5' DNA nuclease
MSYLFTQMALYLLCALALGFILGWLIWGRRSGVDTSEYERLRSDRDRMKGELSAAATANSRLESDLRACRSKSTQLEADLDASRANVTASAAPLMAAGGLAEAPASSFAGERTKPEGLSKPRPGGSDDLKMIKGVGAKMEKLLNTLGYYHFDQIAGWNASEVAWVDENLEGFKGRVTRDEWVSQARILASGGETEFAKRVDKGGVY